MTRSPNRGPRQSKEHHALVPPKVKPPTLDQHGRGLSKPWRLALNRCLPPRVVAAHRCDS